MKYTPIYTCILIIIIAIVGYFIGIMIRTEMSKNRESMRTLPRPTRHPMVPIYNSAPIFGPFEAESMNQIIDQKISSYFDDNGVPYSYTIQLYQKLCVNNGNASNQTKSQLTDIGYYILDIVIPNIPTANNPTPTVSWPSIRWTGMQPFPLHISPRPTYLIYAGQPQDSFSYQYNAASSQPGFNNTSNNNTHAPGSITPGSSSSNNEGDSGSSTANQCGICTDCMATALGLANTDPTPPPGGASSSSSSGSSTNSQIVQTVNATGSMAYTSVGPERINSNITIVGSSVVNGSAITDASQNNVTVPSPLHEFITTEIIKNYFIESGPNRGKPTQAAIDLFNEYTQGYSSPMDDFHKNKLRDVVYYVLQNIIPGLPTPQLPRSYVEWIPIVWLSKNSKPIINP
jgi:hypothetical protein